MTTTTDVTLIASWLLFSICARAMYMDLCTDRCQDTTPLHGELISVLRTIVFTHHVVYHEFFQYSLILSVTTP